MPGFHDLQATLVSPGSSEKLFSRIDLRALQFVRKIDVDRFPLGVKINRPKAALAMSVAGGLGAAKGQMHLSANRWRIYIRDTGVNVAHGAERLIYVARVDRRREPIRHAVGDLNRLIEAVDGDEAEHRAKDFLLGNAHLLIHVSEDRRLKEPAIGVAGSVQRLAAGFQLCALILADLDVPFRSGHLLLVDLRPHVYAFVKPITDFQPLRAIDKPVCKLAVDALLHDHAAGSGAA